MKPPIALHQSSENGKLCEGQEPSLSQRSETSTLSRRERQAVAARGLDFSLEAQAPACADDSADLHRDEDRGDSLPWRLEQQKHAETHNRHDDLRGNQGFAVLSPHERSPKINSQ